MSSPEASRLAYVDSLRFVAAGLVVLQHLSDRLGSSLGGAVAHWAPGITGVVLFFLISGFVIPFSVREPFEAKGFLVKRVFRIYPLFLVALAIVTLCGIGGVLPEWADLGEARPLRWIANLLLVQDIVGVRPILGVSWTLIIELAWYALFAASLTLFKDRAAGLLSLLLPFGLIALAVASLFLHVRIPLARPGMVYAAAFGFQVFRHVMGRISGRTLLGHLAVFLVVMSFANVVSFGIYFHPRVGMWQAVLPWALAPLCFTLAMTLPRLRQWPALNQGLLPRLGQWSYSLYLLHPIAIALAFHLLSPMAAAVSGAVLSLLLSWVGFNWIESPGIALGRRLLSRPIPLARVAT